MIWSIECKRSNCRFLDGGKCAYSDTVSLDIDGKCKTFKPHEHHISEMERLAEIGHALELAIKHNFKFVNHGYDNLTNITLDELKNLIEWKKEMDKDCNA